MFYEKDLIEKSDHELIRSMTDSRVFMQLVEFEVPSFLEKPVPPVIQGQYQTKNLFSECCTYKSDTRKRGNFFSDSHNRHSLSSNST